MATRIVLAHEPPFAIGPLEVRPSVRTVVRNGREEVLEPRVMQVLVALAKADGQVVSRDDLAECCWDGRVVGEDAINRVLSRLRRLAEGNGAGAFSLETITRIGYRMVRLDEATPAGVATPQPIVSPTPPPRAAGRTLSRRSLVAGSVGLATVALAGAGYWIAQRPKLPKAAQEAIARGKDAQRDGTPDQLATAIGAFRQATDIAPGFAAPWGTLAYAYKAQARGLPASQQALLIARAREAADRALAIDPDDPDAQAALIGLRPVYRNWLVQHDAISRLLERHPDSVAVNAEGMELYMQTGQTTLLMQCVERIHKLEPPFAKIFTWLVMGNWSRGRFDDADHYMAQAFAQWPRYYSTWFTRERLLCFTGRAAEALAMIDDIANRPIGIPDWNFANVRLEVQAMLTRAPADIAAAVKSYGETAPRGLGFANNAAQFFSAIGRIDDALHMLEAIYFDRGVRIGDERYSIEQGQYITHNDRDVWILWFPMCAGLRADPRLLAILKEIGLVDFWRARGIKPEVPIAGL